MPQHLSLPGPLPVGSRRAGRGPRTPKREHSEHGRRLRDELDEVVRAPRRLDRGVDPDLVFKIRATGRPTDSGLDGRNLRMLAETRDWTYFVLSQDEGEGLRSALDDYTATDSNKSLLALFEAIEPYGPSDRRGPGLDQLPDQEPFRVDIRIWASPGNDEAQRRSGIVENILQRGDAQVELRSPRPKRNLIRARVSAGLLENLLATSVIEQIRTPPVPFLDFRDWRTLGADDLRRIEVHSAEVGVLDDEPASNHPLLRGLISSIDAVGPPEYPWQLSGNHGTEVVGRVLLPELHEQLRDGTPITVHGTVRVARILEPDPARPGGPPRFATSQFPHQLVEDGIRQLHGQYGVRVFNLSVGYDEPASELHLGELTETIDELIRELDIVVTVPTGNVSLTRFTALTPSGHHVADDYPDYLDTPDHQLAEPAPAALAVTVGSVAHSDAVAEIGNRLGWQAIAGVDQVSPFSRTGPGLGTADGRHNKPDLVHYGGNTVLNDSGHVVPNDMGASIVSTALDPDTGRLFAACNGTSYAAPAVARVAADILHHYPAASGNLVRTLLGLSARQPAAARDIPKSHRRAALFGMGLPTGDRAIISHAQRATMTYQGSIPRDTVHIHPVPIPELFRRGRGTARTVTVGLAFDPPVRRQRREYLAATMSLDLYRNIDPEELAAVLKRQDPEDAQDTITGRSRPTLVPSSRSFSSSTLHIRRWRVTKSFIDDEDTFYLAVTHRAAAWAPDDYTAQTYALAVELEDRQLQEADLHQLLALQLQEREREREHAELRLRQG